MTESVSFDFLPEKWRIGLQNSVFVGIYYENVENFAENIRHFRRKSDTFSIFGGGNPPSLIGKPDHDLGW